MKFVTAQEIKDLLVSENIFDYTGNITIDIHNTRVIIRQNDIIGNALQEWVGGFLESKGIYYRSAIGQTFPDFYLSADNKRNICEMKTFLDTATAAFDIGNFFGYINTIKENPYRLDSDYLIFAYYSDEEGNITIKDIWCKKVWEITGPAKSYALKCQRRNKQIVNIRPINWRSNRAVLKPFNNKAEYIAALYKTLLSTNNHTRTSQEWLKAVIEGYREFSGVDLTNDINALL